MSTNTLDRLNGINSGIAIKAPVRVIATTDITLSGEQTIDGVAVVAGDRVCKAYGSAVDNGIYDVSTSAWTRSLDFNGNRDIVTGTAVIVTGGTLYANTIWVVSTTGTITIDTTSISFGLAPITSPAMTSVTSNAIATGAKTFTTQAGLPLYAGQFVLISDTANSANYMHGTVTSYSGTTLVTNILDIGGSGTKTSWNIQVSAPQGTAGATGATGGTTLTTNLQTDNYTLVLGDAGSLIAMSKGTAVNLTVPLNSSVAFPTGTQILIENTGAGLVTVVATGGVTINKAAAFTLVLREQWSMAALIKKGTDTWTLSGDLTLA